VVKIKELVFEDSKQFLDKFQKLENSYGTDWYDCEDKEAKYIWLIKDIENPLGFLSYKILLHPNQKDFIYIVKIYVLEDYRGKIPILIEDERVSEILFRQINRKGVNILTLESACDKLDNYYKSLGFKYNEDISNVFSSAIGTKEKIMVKQLFRITEQLF
jgi:hypothetical protein